MPPETGRAGLTAKDGRAGKTAVRLFHGSAVSDRPMRTRKGGGRCFPPAAFVCCPVLGRYWADLERLRQIPEYF
jgi:uncharacterized protein YllA (UPF0747 family)